MLILTRKSGESLYIGDGIKLTVLGIQGKQAKLGITLPDNMTVYREEIYDLIAGDNTLARQSKKDKLNSSAIPKVFEINTRLGIQEISEDEIISFPKGLIGYEDEKSFTLLAVEKNSAFSVLQSTKTPDLGFIVVDPYIYIDDYSVKINDTELAIMDVKRSDDIFVFATITIPHGKAEQAMLNLTGPIFINQVKRVGMQIPQDVKATKVLISDCVDRINKNNKNNNNPA